MVPDKIQTWQMVRPASKDASGRLEKTEIPVPELAPDEVLVEVAGCGVCHTDLGYFYDGVPTVAGPPLALGHEISGRVVAGNRQWVGREVIVPAVMPCRKCLLCKTGRGNRCLDQKMPGNSIGIYGGFSSHIPVPCIDLCEIGDRGDIPLEHLAVVADAVTTPFQAAKRAGLEIGDNAVVIGIGGVGQYMVQTAKALGAKTVVAVDIDKARLEKMLSYGADFAINATGKTPRDVSGELKSIRKQKDLPVFGWKIFEVTGTKPGQETALSLLGFTGKLIVVGFGMAKIKYSVSRLMAFDAEIIGTWGCLPEYYPQVLEMVLSKKIVIDPFVRTRPMSQIAEAFDQAHKKAPDRRIVLVPDFQ